MSEYILPLPNPPIGSFDFGITLEQIGYLLAFQWNSKDVAWYFDVFDVAGKPIRRSIKVVLGTFLGNGCQHPLFTNGVFVAVDLSPNEQEALFEDFGTRVIMKYIPVLDLVTRVTALG